MIRTMQYTSYHDLLNDEFQKRKNMNASYSLRAFARDLSLPAPRLSQILNKKQGLSVDTAEVVAKKLKLNDNKAKWFCHSVGALHARSVKERNEFKSRIQDYKEEAKVFNELQLEYFKVISDWYHFAILELTYLSTFQNDPRWMADMLGISIHEVQEAIARMMQLELITEKDGKLIDTFKFLATPNDVPSVSLKKFHTQLMKKAMEAIFTQDVLEREYASNIVSIKKERIPEFKEKLRDFRREFEHDASKHTDKDSVYCLSMQFYELTRRDP
jgi:uncharacterized protein (TIGR02147 family)